MSAYASENNTAKQDMVIKHKLDCGLHGPEMVFVGSGRLDNGKGIPILSAITGRELGISNDIFCK